jgi:hypothetical protein
VNPGQMSFIEAKILLILKSIGEDTTLFYLGEQAGDIDALINSSEGFQKIGGRGEQVTGAEDISLLEVITGRSQLHQTMEEFSRLAGFEGDQLLKIIVTLEKSTAVEELDPLF